jgi:hypothetical protein
MLQLFYTFQKEMMICAGEEAGLPKISEFSEKGGGGFNLICNLKTINNAYKILL